MDFLGDIKVYANWLYLAIAGYLGWNHKRIDNVIVQQAIANQKIVSLEENIKHIRDGVDKLTNRFINENNNHNNGNT